MNLDSHGRLLYFQAVPPQREAPPAGVKPADWSGLFAAAGLDTAQFQETPSEWNFLNAADERKAWKGHWPGTARALRVEAAAWRGRPVSFLLIGDWLKPWRMPGSDSGVSTRNIVILIFACLALGGGALLSRRNWLLGKVDRKGAMRLASFSFILMLLIWLCSVHLNRSLGVFGMLLIAIATSIGWSAVYWMLYVAIEPLVRRYWPQSIISWSSIAVGNWRDPVVGRDILVGMALGIGIRLIDRVVEYWVPAGVPDFVQMSILDGFRPTLAATLTKVVFGIRSALMFFILLFLMRILLRRQWFAAIGFVSLFSFLAAVGSSGGFWLQLAANAPAYALIAVAVVRLGLLSLMVAFFVADLAPLMAALQPAAWYFPNMLFVATILIGLAIWSCRIAVKPNGPWSPAR